MSKSIVSIQCFLRAIELANDGTSANDRKTQKFVRQNLRKSSLAKTHDKNDRWRATADVRKFVLSLSIFAGVTPPTTDHVAQASKELNK